MSEPKLHHYVPRFYLASFVGARKCLWVYDKDAERIFATSPERIAAETHFYRLPESVGIDDPLLIEKAFAALESKAAPIFSRIVTEAGNLAPLEKMSISVEERKLLSEFIAAQYFRTVEFRDLLAYLMEGADLSEADWSQEERKTIHFMLLSESGLVEDFGESVFNAIWMFAKNHSSTALITSDHPVCVKDHDSKMWLKGIGPLTDGSYIVYPISPSLVLYCKELTFWEKLWDFDLCVSPVILNDDMVHHENCGQAFMAARFLISCSNDFQQVREFIPSIGTDMYTREGFAGSDGIKRTADYIGKRRGKV
ncbi:MAG TPA: DUF4238 domain-containing protein [Pyrinomonadaceae bacterium]